MNHSLNRIHRMRWMGFWLALGLLIYFVDGLLMNPPSLNKPERVDLWEGRQPNNSASTPPSDAILSIYHPRQANGTALIICPGGGYGDLVLESEGKQTAQWLARNGIIGIVLEYRLPQGNPEIPLMDAKRAIRYVRMKAKDWGVDSHRIGILGFSAGGHLAATASTHFDKGNPTAEDPIKRESSRPDFTILIYPVITMGLDTDEGTKLSLLGAHPTPEAIESYSIEKQVTDRTPPAFLVHAMDDPVVTAKNSRLYTRALRAHQVPVEFLELPAGGHGLGYGGPLWDHWQKAAVRWMASQRPGPE